MNKKTKLIMFLTFILFLFSGVHYLAMADDHKEKKWYQKKADHDDDHSHKDKHRKRKRERNTDDEHHENNLRQVNNPVYKEECGACHYVYQPELLPSASWAKILESLDDHFGDAVELGNDEKKAILDYLMTHSAEKSSSKRAIKIMRSLGNQVPLRITDIDYIRKKHHEISSDVLKRKSIGSLSNCSACHTTAESGIYDDDDVRIPQ
ncbi:MAG: hypothetical protein HKP58_04050 [Desulfatitalea sp.]|nr:diheme cytochrome c [Desulfatitalea sp.]NNJ99566.1 hypothetical protein [Desulfatitalea sp.]